MVDSERIAMIIVDNIIEELTDRGGFDGWWDDCDDQIQEEIKDTLREMVVRTLESE